MSRKSFREIIERRLTESEITPLLPCVLGEPQAMPDDLVGATITAIGSIAGENCGLAIEYKKSGVTWRVLLVFGDAGMFVSGAVQVSG